MLGASAIAAIYHFILFIQQRDKFLLFYSLYLFTLTSYISFKLISNNYNPFLPTSHLYYNFIEETLQILMVTVYCTFAAVTVECTKEPPIVRNWWIAFLILSIASIIYHYIKSITYHSNITTKLEYGLSRFSLITIAVFGLCFAWHHRTSVFQRTIIIGSFVYAFSGLLSSLSFVFGIDILDYSGVEPYLLGCLIDIIIFSTAFGYRIKLIAQQKNELLKNQLAIIDVKNKIAQDLHDDVGATLSSMQLYGELANSVWETKPEKSKEMLAKITSQSKELITRMSDIIWSLKPVNEIHTLDILLKNYSAELLAPKNILCSFHIDEITYTFIDNPETKKNILLIAKEAINNIAKYSQANNATVSLLINEGFLILSVIDDGKGFDTNNYVAGNGLSNIKKRATFLKANIVITSSVGNGTSVICEIPL